MSIIRVKPAPGRRVRLHDGRLLPQTGWDVEDDVVWQRRLRDGDVVIDGAPAALLDDAAEEHH
jgi:hypothetical protein